MDPSPIILPNPGVKPEPPPGVKPVLNVAGSNADDPPARGVWLIPLELFESFCADPLASLLPLAPCGLVRFSAGPVNMAGESGPARKEEDRPDHEKWGPLPGSREAGDVRADTGGNAVVGVLRCEPS